MIWAETKQEPLLENLSSKHKMIKFEHNISHVSISFLDTLIDKEQNNTFQTTLYRKPTDQISMINNLYEHSDHPQSTLKNQETISPTLLEYEKH